MIIKTDQPLIANRAVITQTIADFWNKTTEGWRMVWGPHIHHGYYENNNSLTPLAAQEALIDKVASLLTIAPKSKILDAGCGMGGSSIYLAEKFHALMTGITLSQKQVDIAIKTAREKKISNVAFHIEDALSMASFADNSFDIVWSLESCEQFYDKNLFLQQALRVLKPGGKLMLATWCSDRDEYTGESAKQYKKLCYAFDLPYMPTIAHYQKQLELEGFTVTYSADWSEQVEKSWDIGISLVNGYSFLHLLRMAGLRGLRFAQQLKLMRAGFRNKHVRYGVFCAEKS